MPSIPWNHGLAEMSGQRNKYVLFSAMIGGHYRDSCSNVVSSLSLSLSCRLCVSSLAVSDFAEGVEALYGMFDGDKNEEVPRLLQCTMGDVLLEEVHQSNCDRMFMCHTFLVSHRSLPYKLSANVLYISFFLQDQIVTQKKLKSY